MLFLLSQSQITGAGRRGEKRNDMQVALPRICPRCNGSMIVERDWYGSYSTCICCGHVQEAVSSPAIDLLLEDEEGHGRQRRRQPSHGKLRL
jgi:hypothetical protein